MRTIFAVVLVLCSGAAMAQTSPPTVGGKPLVQVKPRGETHGGAAKPQSVAAKLQACLEIDDATKERLESAPGFDKDHWPSMADRAWATDIHEYYDEPPYWDDTLSASSG